MGAAVALQVRGVGGPAVGMGDGVVDVAVECRVVATWPATRQIPASHEIGERLRRHISRLGCGVEWMNQRHQLGVSGQLGDELGSDQPVGAHLGRRRVARVAGVGFLGNHVDHHRCCGGTLSGGTVTASALTAQAIGSHRKRAQRVGAALLATTRIVFTHGGGQRREPLVHRVRLGAQQAAVDF